jgi:hypothetical protein
VTGSPSSSAIGTEKGAALNWRSAAQPTDAAAVHDRVTPCFWLAVRRLNHIVSARTHHHAERSHRDLVNIDQAHLGADEDRITARP